MVHLNRATCSTLFLNADMAMVWPILTSAARGELPSQFFKQEIVFLYGKQKRLSKQKLPRNQEPMQMAWNMRSYSTRTLHSKGCAVSTCNMWAYVLYIYIYIYICIYLYTQYYIGDLMSEISESNWLLHASAWQKPVVSAARQCHGGHERKPSNIFRRNMASNGLKCDQWIGLRENLNRKLWFFPWNMGLSGEHFAVKTNPLIWDSTQLPLIDGLPIKNGDFPWLCYITRWPKIWDFTQLH